MRVAVRHIYTRKFLKGSKTWNFSWVDDINNARVYPNAGSATLSAKRILKENTGKPYVFETVPIEIREVSKAG